MLERRGSYAFDYDLHGGSAPARIHYDGASHDLAAGDALLAPVGSDHDLANTGTGPLRVLVVWGEPGTADYSSFGSWRSANAARNPADGAPTAR
ncbi:cupin domain-containing protein [Arthrobacter crystallopoietes]|uniref:cupin domain-containing protein n=1 Tax=Crystallibacter crystallopoietes TaxID=37928 RepID=UPI003D1C129E